MNPDRIRGGWKQFRGGLKAAWGRLIANSELEREGRSEVLAGKLQEAYGIGRDQADAQVHAWQRSIQEIADAHDGVPRTVGAGTEGSGRLSSL